MTQQQINDFCALMFFCAVICIGLVKWHTIPPTIVPAVLSTLSPRHGKAT